MELNWPTTKKNPNISYSRFICLYKSTQFEFSLWPGKGAELGFLSLALACRIYTAKSIQLEYYINLDYEICLHNNDELEQMNLKIHILLRYKINIYIKFYVYTKYIDQFVNLMLYHRDLS